MIVETIAPESRQKSRHFGGMMTRQASSGGNPAKNPAILAGYAEHAIGEVAMALTMGMLGKIKKQVMREGDGK